MLVLAAIGYVAIVALGVVLIDWGWPGCSLKKLILIPSVPVPFVLATAAVVGFFWFDHKPTRPDVGVDDAGGYVLLFAVMLPLGGAVLTLALGIVTAELVSRFLRPKR